MSDRDEFEKWANQFNHDSGRWEDMGRDEVFIAGMKAARQGGEVEPVVAYRYRVIDDRQGWEYSSTPLFGPESGPGPKEEYQALTLDQLVSELNDAKQPNQANDVPEYVIDALSFYAKCSHMSDPVEDGAVALKAIHRLMAHPPASTQGVPEEDLWEVLHEAVASMPLGIAEDDNDTPTEHIYHAIKPFIAPNRPSGEWVRCADNMPKLGQRVILKSQGVVQHYMPVLDESDEGLFWEFEQDENPLVDFENDEWIPQPPKDKQEGSGDE